MEIKTEIKVFRVELKCDTCKKGTMICINPDKVAEGDRRKHQCSNDECQEIRWITGKIYPRTEYEDSTMVAQLVGAAKSGKQKLQDILSKKPALKKAISKTSKK
jgi:hypothetical protein